MGPSPQLNNIWVLVSVNKPLVLPITYYLFTHSPFIFTNAAVSTKTPEAFGGGALMNLGTERVLTRMAVV